MSKVNARGEYFNYGLDFILIVVSNGLSYIIHLCKEYI